MTAAALRDAVARIERSAFARTDRGASAIPRRSERRRGVAARLLRWFAIAVLGWLLITACGILLLRRLDPPSSAFMVEARLTAFLRDDRHYHTEYQWVDLERISAHAAIAVIASEDQQFPFHAGFDLGSIRQSVRASEQGRKLRGASTISQQVAKNLFLWNGRSFLRKGLEAWLTVLLEALWPKERILEMYLNIVEFGPGVYGVEAAARHFYHKSAARLTGSEAALLAAVLPNPARLRLEQPSRYLLQRRDWILGQMRDLGGTAYLQALEREARPRRH